MTKKEFKNFGEFYPFYLSEHRHPVCRGLHFTGTFLILLDIGLVLLTSRGSLLWAVPFLGYGFAWVGHFFFEKNRPATFQYPFYSLAGDWVMFKDLLLLKIRV